MAPEGAAYWGKFPGFNWSCQLILVTDEGNKWESVDFKKKKLFWYVFIILARGKKSIKSSSDIPLPIYAVNTAYTLATEKTFVLDLMRNPPTPLSRNQAEIWQQNKWALIQQTNKKGREMKKIMEMLLIKNYGCLSALLEHAGQQKKMQYLFVLEKGLIMFCLLTTTTERL